MASKKHQPDAVVLPKDIAELPTGHLQLPPRVAWSADEFTTLGQLVQAFVRERPLDSRSVTLKRTRVVRNLLSAVREGGLLGWDRFRRTRPLFVTRGSIYFFSPSFKRLQKAVSDGRLEQLHLSRRAITALHAVTITTIGDLIQHSRRGIVGLSASGELTSTEIVQSLDALADAVVVDGTIDWIRYAERRGFQLLPHVAHDVYSGAQFLWHFPKACEHAVASKFGSLGTTLLRHRLFRHRDILVPLPEIGRHLGLSGERCRLLERSIIEMLQRAVWQEEYRGCRFRFRRGFLRPLCQLRESIQNLSDDGLSLDRWRTVLRECWGVEPENLGQQEMIILQLLGIESYPEEASAKVAGGPDSSIHREIVSEIKALFSRQPALAFTREDIRQHLFAKFGASAPESSRLAEILEQVSDVEVDRKSGRYQIAFEHLKKIADQCERILRESGSPMHYGELTAEIDRLLPEGAERPLERTVANHLAESKRFVAVARSGRWALPEWGRVETRSVAAIAADLLRESKLPLTEGELFDSIAARRPAKRQSIGTLLRQDGRFRRVGPRMWTLAESRQGSEEYT